MPQIYDIASKLDYSGVEAPARLNAARISIAEQTAREEPLRFAQQQKEWQRGDEQYQQQQEQYRQGQELARQSQLFGKAARIAAVSQTPQAFVRNLTQALGDDIRDPFWSGMLAEVNGADQVTFNKMKPELGSAITNVGGLFDSQLKMRAEQEKQAAELKKEQASIGGRQAVAETQAAASRYAADKRLEGVQLNIQAKRDLAKKAGTSVRDIDLLERGGARRFEQNYWTGKEWKPETPGLNPETGEVDPHVRTNLIYNYVESVIGKSGSGTVPQEADEDMTDEDTGESATPSWRDYQ